MSRKFLISVNGNVYSNGEFPSDRMPNIEGIGWIDAEPLGSRIENVNLKRQTPGQYQRVVPVSLVKVPIPVRDILGPDGGAQFSGYDPESVHYNISLDFNSATEAIWFATQYLVNVDGRGLRRLNDGNEVNRDRIIADITAIDRMWEARGGPREQENKVAEIAAREATISEKRMDYSQGW